MERFYRDTKKNTGYPADCNLYGRCPACQECIEMPCMTLCMEQVFIAELPEEEIYQTAAHKLVENDGELTEQELMQLVVLPLAARGVERKQERIEQVIRLAKADQKGSRSDFCPDRTAGKYG